MPPIRTVIADDEPLAAERLKRLLLESDCDVLAQFEDGNSLLDWLKNNPPLDVIFLDIQMPGLNGLEVIAELEDPPPAVFVTAHPEFAVQSYELPAIDFLLKPVFSDRLAKTLDRVRHHRIPALSRSDIATMRVPLQRVAIKAGEGTVYMDLKTLTHFEFKKGQVLAYRGSSSYLTRWMHLTDVENAFPNAGLIRIHRNLLLRPEAVIGSRPAFGGRLKVKIGNEVELTASLAASPVLKAILSHP